MVEYKNITKEISALKSIARSGETDSFLNDSTKIFNAGSQSISFIGRDTDKSYESIVAKLLNFKNIQDTISEKEFNKALVRLLQNLFEEQRDCTPADAKTLYSSLLALEVQTYERFCPLYGVKILSDKLELGPFCIYNADIIKNKLIKDYKYVREHPETYLENLDSPYLIGLKVVARDSEKAKELSESYFRSFENVLSYVIGDLNHIKCPGIFQFTEPRGISTLLHNGKTVISTNENLTVSVPVNLDDESYNSQENGTGELWSLITKPYQAKTDIERRILTAVEWAGQAIRELDMKKALVEFVFALEGLLKMDSEGIITPSIISQIGDWLAFIIAEDVSNRVKVVDMFKEVYRKRSAIAHGGAKNILRSDCIKAFFLCHQAILTLLIDKELSKIKTIKELDAWVIQQRYK
ncbi:MAG: hypothetical protein JWP57_3673 [Spirosoma sp.]|nr:hypothetical protein [Spirosoma sp.]